MMGRRVTYVSTLGNFKIVRSLRSLLPIALAHHGLESRICI